MPFVGGNITDENGDPAARVVRIYDRATSVKLNETTSDDVTGDYSVFVPNTDEVQRIVLDDATADPLLNDIIDRVIPAGIAGIPAWEIGSCEGLMEELTSVFIKDATPTHVARATANIPVGDNRYAGFVTAPNGMLYGIPNSADTILKFDPVTKETTTFGTLTVGTYKWKGGVLAPNGKIYAMPYTATAILVIDTTNDTVAEVGPIGEAGENWCGGTLGADGKIYAAPRNVATTTVLVIDPTDNSYSFFPGYNSANLFAGSCPTPDGKIIFSPSTSDSILEIDPIQQTYTTFAPAAYVAWQYSAPTLAPNGKLYCAPYHGEFFLEIDPVGRTATLFGEIAVDLSNRFDGLTLAPNGKLYAAPMNHGEMVELNPDTLELVYTRIYDIADDDTMTRFRRGTLAADGNLYFAPYSDDTGSIFELSFSPSLAARVSDDIVLSAGLANI